ncbi:TadE family type IV pilus minor pilin [Ornithinimicrobium sufpigmenti]|uniref:TadE family type IV pilus minor pilin n=1 Tax=Ornithinimicrobium sufpigmenti TaxID=2508882 RepID=UPI001035E3C2|nr:MULTISPECIES: TadE family type IV pilus minor pilin [unclassified Ornithinimicrobium]
MVSAELALTVPSILLVLAICLTALALAIDLVRVTDAARVGARAASRGEAPAEVQRLVLDRAPEGSHLHVGHEDELVVVRVEAPSRSRLIPLPQAQAQASAVWEPGAGP